MKKDEPRTERAKLGELEVQLDRLEKDSGRLWPAISYQPTLSQVVTKFG